MKANGTGSSGRAIAQVRAPVGSTEIAPRCGWTVGTRGDPVTPTVTLELLKGTQFVLNLAGL